MIPKSKIALFFLLIGYQRSLFSQNIVFKAIKGAICVHSLAAFFSRFLSPYQTIQEDEDADDFYFCDGNFGFWRNGKCRLFE